MDMKNKILVTGGAGFIGSSMAEKLAKNNYEVVIVDNLITGSLEKLPDRTLYPNVSFIPCDVNKIEEISKVFEAHQFDAIFHYAALVGVLRTLNHPIQVLEDIKGIENILKLSVQYKVPHIYYSSSSEVYGEPVEFPQNETTTPLNSRLPYAIVKNLGEAYLRSYQQEHNINFTIFRFFNTYGPKQSKDFVISKFVDAAVQNKPITIYGDGSQTRTFCFVEDNIDACFEAFQSKKVLNDVVNIGGDDEITVKELAEIIIRVTNSSSEIIHLPALKEGDMTRRRPDITKMKTLLTRERTPFEQGLRYVVEAKISKA